MRFIGPAYVRRFGVTVGEYGDGPEAELLGSADDADCDFTAVGDQKLAQIHLACPHVVTSEGCWKSKAA
jgi:hypothetical protein